MSTIHTDGNPDFAPGEAYELLTATRRAARRGFESRGPLVCLFTAAILFLVYGLLWNSVRGQHPYVGPTGATVGWVYGIVAVSSVVTTLAYRRAAAGVHGRSRRDDMVAALVVGVPWAAVYVFAAALKVAGAGPGIYVGVFDAAGPWLVVGAASAALTAGREQWGRTACGLGAVAIGTTAVFFGPIGCWGVLAIGGAAGSVAAAVVQFVRLRRG